MMSIDTGMKRRSPPDCHDGTKRLKSNSVSDISGSQNSKDVLSFGNKVTPAGGQSCQKNKYSRSQTHGGDGHKFDREPKLCDEEEQSLITPSPLLSRGECCSSNSKETSSKLPGNEASDEKGTTFLKGHDEDLPSKTTTSQTRIEKSSNGSEETSPKLSGNEAPGKNGTAALNDCHEDLSPETAAAQTRVEKSSSGSNETSSEPSGNEADKNGTAALKEHDEDLSSATDATQTSIEKSSSDSKETSSEPSSNEAPDKNGTAALKEHDEDLSSEKADHTVQRKTDLKDGPSKEDKVEKKSTKKKGRKNKNQAAVSNDQGFKPGKLENSVEVVFHVLIAERWKLNPQKDNVFIHFGAEILGGWNYGWKMEFKRKLPDKDIFEYSCHVPMPEGKREYKYKYTVYKKEEIWEEPYYRQKDYSEYDPVNRCIVLSNRDKLSQGSWHHYDGFVYPKFDPPKGIWKSFKEFLWASNSNDITEQILKDTKFAVHAFMPSTDAIIACLSETNSSDLYPAEDMFQRVLMVFTSLKPQMLDKNLKRRDPKLRDEERTCIQSSGRFVETRTEAKSVNGNWDTPDSILAEYNLLFPNTTHKDIIRTSIILSMTQENNTSPLQ